MKIIKALKKIAVPVRANKPSQFVRKQVYAAGEVIAVHEETLKTLKDDSYAVYSGKDFVKPKKNEEKQPVQDPVLEDNSEVTTENAD